MNNWDFSLQKNKGKNIKKYFEVPNKWRTIESLVNKDLPHGRRWKGTAESFSRQKLRQALQKEGGEVVPGPGE